MKIKKLFEILTLVKSVRSRRWNDVLLLVNEINNNTVDVKEKKWHEKYKQDNPDYYPLELSEIRTWSTYEDECIDLEYYIENDKLVCKATIYDGDNFNGERRNIRFTAKLWLPNSFAHTIEAKISYGLDRMAEDAYEDYLETQRKLWVSNFKSQIIGVPA
jgi:hypothetical protein